MYLWLSGFFKRWFVFILAVLGMGMVYLATCVVGPGVSGDSVRYLSAATNILAGRGVVDYSLQPLLTWPPLYPLVLAGGALLLGDVFLAGWALNILCYGFMIVLVWKLTEAHLPGSRFAPLIAALVALCSPSLLRLHTGIVADALFLVLILSFLLLATNYLVSGQKRVLAGMALIATLAELVKYPGLALAFVGGVVVLYRQARLKNGLRGLLWGAGFGAVCGLPLGLWVFLHNYRLYGSMFGERGSGGMLENLTITLEKILYWLLPYGVQQRLGGPYVLLAVLAILAVGLMRPDAWRSVFRLLGGERFLPTSVFFCVYFAMMLFLVSYAEHKDYRVDRLHVILLIPLWQFILAVVSEDRLRFRWPGRFGGALLAILFAGWLLFPLANLAKYVRLSLENGEVANNIYNTPALNESDVVLFLRAHPLPADAVVYSNHEGAAWFFTRLNTFEMPQGDRGEEGKLAPETVLAQYAGWPPAPGYIVWFNLDFKLHVLPPSALGSIAELRPLYVGAGGEVDWMEKMK